MIKTQLSGIQSLGSLSSAFRSLGLSSTVQLAQKSNIEIPKRPVTPWISYYTKNIPAYKKHFPGQAAPELLKKINSEWVKVANTEKERMMKMYQRELELFKKKMEKVPQDKLDEIQAEKKAMREEKAEKKAKTEMKALLVSYNKPKRPSNAFLLYSKDRLAELPDNMKHVDKVARMGAEWRKATKTKKDYYEEKQAKLTKKYEKDLAEWSIKMYKQGKMEHITAAEKNVAKYRKSA